MNKSLFLPSPVNETFAPEEDTLPQKLFYGKQNRRKSASTCKLQLSGRFFGQKNADIFCLWWLERRAHSCSHAWWLTHFVPLTATLVETYRKKNIGRENLNTCFTNWMQIFHNHTFRSVLPLLLSSTTKLSGRVPGCNHLFSLFS